MEEPGSRPRDPSGSGDAPLGPPLPAPRRRGPPGPGRPDRPHRTDARPGGRARVAADLEGPVRPRRRQRRPARAAHRRAGRPAAARGRRDRMGSVPPVGRELLRRARPGRAHPAPGPPRPGTRGPAPTRPGCPGRPYPSRARADDPRNGPPHPARPRGRRRDAAGSRPRRGGRGGRHGDGRRDQQPRTPRA
ncbi:hypothetical protein NOCARDAX2BIS_100055 [Nocardioides sp. AX2bis]|nr:hypothetical protein NOCARDAX2BIS_100055 [Nocardioides sp. AX2bis]